LKICFVTHGNIEKLATMKRATGMANHLTEYGHEVSILCTDVPENRKRICFECPSVNVRWISAISAFDEVKQKNKHLIEISPDVVYVCSLGIRNWINRRVLSKCFSVVEHSELSSIIIDKGFVGRLRARMIEWASIFLFDGQVCASRFLELTFKNRMKKVGIERPIHYSPYAYNQETLKFPNIPGTTSFETYDGKTVILYMGTLTKNYGFFDILSSFNKLCGSRDDLVLLIMGHGRHEKAGALYIDKHNLGERVKLLGYIPEEDLALFFARTDIFLSPLYDTLQDIARCPSKLFMYLPFQKPIITCSIGEAYELFGKSGFYYTSGDIDSLAETIVRALDHVGLAYPAMDVSQHSWQERTAQFIRWINDVSLNERR